MYFDYVKPENTSHNPGHRWTWRRRSALPSGQYDHVSRDLLTSHTLHILKVKGAGSHGKNNVISRNADIRKRKQMCLHPSALEASSQFPESFIYEIIADDVYLFNE